MTNRQKTNISPLSLPRNHFGLKRYSGIDHEGNNIGFQCKSLSVNINNQLYTILIDVGAGFDNQLPSGLKEDINTIDAIALTHNHYDHSSGLPIIIKDYLTGVKLGDKPIFMSNITAQLIEPILYDMAKNHENQTTLINKKIKAQGGNDFVANLYKKEDIAHILRHKQLIDPRGYETSSHRLFNNQMNIRALYASHIFGANQYLFKITGNGKTKNTNILYTGDLGRIKDPIHFDPPETIQTEKIDYMIIEGTYANKHHNDRDTEQKNLIEKIKHREGKILIPTFSNTRLMQIVLILWEHWNMYFKNKDSNTFDLWRGAKVFIDSKLGMSLYRELCSYNGEIPGFNQEQVNTLKTIFDSIMTGNAMGPFAIASKKTILERSQKDIIIAGGGMGTVGPSSGYIPRFLDNCDKNHIIFTGYQAEGTTGRIIQDKGIARLNGKFYDLKSDKFKDKDISSSISMSAHADQSDLLSYIEQTSKRSDCKIFIDHTGITGYVLKDRIISELGLKPENIIIPELHKNYIYPI